MTEAQLLLLELLDDLIEAISNDDSSALDAADEKLDQLRELARQAVCQVPPPA